MFHYPIHSASLQCAMRRDSVPFTIQYVASIIVSIDLLIIDGLGQLAAAIVRRSST